MRRGCGDRVPLAPLEGHVVKGRTSRLRATDPWTVLLAMLGMALVLSGLVVVDTASAQTTKPIELNSTWSDAFTLFESQWIDQFGEAAQPVSVSNVLATGDQFAKRNLLAGDDGGKRVGLDFILSGTRLTAAEVATARGAYTQIPVAISSLAVTLRAPAGSGSQGWRTREPGVTIGDDGAEITNPSLPYGGALKLNPDLLFQLYAGEGFELAADVRFKADNAKPFEERGGVFSAAIGRVDPGAIPKNLRQYFGVKSPASLAQVYTNLQIDPSTLRPEEWPFLAKPTRSNNSSLTNALVQAVTPDGASAAGGIVGLFNTVNALGAVAKYPTVDLRLAELQNGAGTFVAPTKAAVRAGIDAGVGAGSAATTFVDNAALANSTVTDAYPLTWLEWLIVPSTGLTADKTNAVATIARFIVLVGQDDLDKAGTPKLPASLTTSALRAADDLVRSNCTAVGYRVVTRSDAGPAAPPTLRLPANTTIAWCEKIPVAATTTTSTAPPTTTLPTTTTTTVPDDTEDDDVPVSVFPATVSRTFAPPVTTAPTTTVAAAEPMTTTTVVVDTAPATTDTVAPIIEAVVLPNAIPVVERAQFDRVTTMGMGGACLLGAARRYKRKLAQ